MNEDIRKQIKTNMGKLRHKGLYNLAAAIEICLNRIGEGLTAFDVLCQKIKGAQSAKQRSKYETELKREIKRLQRLREQLKGWIYSGEIKQTQFLKDLKQSIEDQMQRYKAIERDTKKKTYTKGGQGFFEPDPFAIEREHLGNWIVACLDELEQQVDQYECETETLTLVKRRKFDKEKYKREEDLKVFIGRHKFHMAHLEKCLRTLDNLCGDTCTLRTADEEAYIRTFLGKLNEVKEDVEYYLNDNQESDFEENLFVYDECESFYMLTDQEQSWLLQESAELVDNSVSSDTVNLEDSHAVEGENSTDGEDAKDEGNEQPNCSGNSENMEYFKESTVNSTQAVKKDAAVHETFQSASAVYSQTTDESTFANELNLDNGTLNYTIVQPGSIPSEFTHNIMPNGFLLKNETQWAPPSPMATDFTHVPSMQPQMAATTAPSIVIPTPTNTDYLGNGQLEFSKAPTGLSNFREFPNNFLALASDVAEGSSGYGGVHHLYPTASRNMDSTNRTSNSSNYHSNHLQLLSRAYYEQFLNRNLPYGFPAEIRRQLIQQLSFSAIALNAQRELHKLSNGSMTDNGVRTREAYIPPSLGLSPLGPMNLQPHHLLQQEMLEVSYNNMPLRSDTLYNKPFLPQQPCPTPSYYPQTPMEISNPLKFYQKYSIETLIFIFYYAEATRAQFYAAKVLKDHHWRFHTRYYTWFRRFTEPHIINSDYEQGEYVYFDMDLWGQVKISNFAFEYKYLEDNVL